MHTAKMDESELAAVVVPVRDPETEEVTETVLLPELDDDRVPVVDADADPDPVPEAEVEVVEEEGRACPVAEMVTLTVVISESDPM